MEMAGAQYEEFAHDNHFYHKWPYQQTYIRHHWKQYVEYAREALVDILTDPGSTEHIKEIVAEALMKDAAMNPPRAHAEQAAAAMSLLN